MVSLTLKTSIGNANKKIIDVRGNFPCISSFCDYGFGWLGNVVIIRFVLIIVFLFLGVLFITFETSGSFFKI